VSRARLASLFAGLAVSSLGVLDSATATPTQSELDYSCSPSPATCAGWYRSDVVVKWRYDQDNWQPVDPAKCLPRWFTTDTPGTLVKCDVRQIINPSSVSSAAVLIRRDSTPPTVGSMLRSRRPDFGGWFNRPVGFRFNGQDATSGVASCSSGTYGGPDGAGVVIRGSCRDVAGNVGVGSFRLNYDATPPPAPEVAVTPGNRKVALQWSAPEAVLTLITRWRVGRPRIVVFRGLGTRYTDRSLRNERRYQYEILVIDRAGNRALSRLTGVPTASKLLNPPRGERVREPPVLRWKRVRRATYYNVQLYRRHRKILSRWPRRSSLRLQRQWRYKGTRRRLAPGRYRWYVWPGYGRRSAKRYGRLLGKSTFTVVR
jgi:hypothetical protein